MGTSKWYTQMIKPTKIQTHIAKIGIRFLSYETKSRRCQIMLWLTFMIYVDLCNSEKLLNISGLNLNRSKVNSSYLLWQNNYLWGGKTKRKSPRAKASKKSTDRCKIQQLSVKQTQPIYTQIMTSRSLLFRA